MIAQDPRPRSGPLARNESVEKGKAPELGVCVLDSGTDALVVF